MSAKILSATERPRICKPNRQADEHVTQDALDEERHKVRLDLCNSRIQYRQPNAAIVHVEMMGKEDQDDKSKRTYQVAEIHDEPIAQHLSRGDFSTRPRHYDQVVTCKQLGASHQYNPQPERKHQAADHASRWRSSPESLATMV